MYLTRFRAAGLCLLAVLAVVGVGGTVDGYSLSGSDAIETPTKTVSYEGQEYTIDAVSRITAGGTVTVTATVPTGAAYNINLRGPDNQLISTERKTNNTDHTFRYFGPDEAGTYVATIEDGGNTVAVHPIVIAGYDVSVPSPDEVAPGEDATIRATITERSVPKHSFLERVEVVVGNDDVEVQQSMTQVDDDTYETTVSTDRLATETYNVYVVVRGNETVRKRAEILGISDTVDLTVAEASTPTPEQTSSSGGGTGGGSDSDTDAEPTTPDEPTPTPTATPAPGATATDTATSKPAVPATMTEETTGGTSPPTASETPTNSGPGNIIAPATESGTATTSGSGPGFTVAVTLLTVVAAFAIGRRR